MKSIFHEQSVDGQRNPCARQVFSQGAGGNATKMYTCAENGVKKDLRLSTEAEGAFGYPGGAAQF